MRLTLDCSFPFFRANALMFGYRLQAKIKELVDNKNCEIDILDIGGIISTEVKLRIYGKFEKEKLGQNLERFEKIRKDQSTKLFAVSKYFTIFNCVIGTNTLELKIKTDMITAKKVDLSTTMENLLTDKYKYLFEKFKIDNVTVVSNENKVFTAKLKCRETISNNEIQESIKDICKQILMEDPILGHLKKYKQLSKKTQPKALKTFDEWRMEKTKRNDPKKLETVKYEYVSL